jgi:hypothetical protein
MDVLRWIKIVKLSMTKFEPDSSLLGAKMRFSRLVVRPSGLGL